MGNTHSSKSGNKSSSNSGNSSSSGMLSTKNLLVGSNFKAPNSIVLKKKECYTVTGINKNVMSTNSNPRYKLTLKNSNGRKTTYTPLNPDTKRFKGCRARTLKKKAK